MSNAAANPMEYDVSPGYFKAAGTTLRSAVTPEQILRAAGLSPYDPLRAATVNPAKFLESSDLQRQLSCKHADMVLLDGDPLESFEQLQNINAVFGNGQLFTRIKLK